MILQTGQILSTVQELPNESDAQIIAFAGLVLTSALATLYVIAGMKPFLKQRNEPGYVYWWRMFLAPANSLAISIGGFLDLIGESVPHPPTLGEYFVFTILAIILAIMAKAYKAQLTEVSQDSSDDEKG